MISNLTLWSRSRSLGRVLLGTVVLASYGHANAIVVRDDVAEPRYRVASAGPSYLVNLPHEGHAVLIADRWLVTAAHTIFYEYSGLSVTIGDGEYTIARVVTHPDYRQAPGQPFEGDSKPLMDFLSSRSDIALIELTVPVSAASPVPIYRGRDELGQRVQIFGRGSTGNGIVGERAETKDDRILRSCENIISGVHDRWLTYDFDPPESALPLEGMHGSGDSGGPSILRVGNQDYLAGLSSWQYFEGDLTEFEPGQYGAIAYQVRVSSYVDWIDAVISARRQEIGNAKAASN